MLAIAAMGDSSAADGAAQLKHREPTPDHPPYSWMIGEAIAALGEGGGGSAEDAISGFIRARHPGVPAAHDRFLRHYLAKHVAEGLFVCAAPGRYSCRADEEGDEPVLALEEGPAAEPKRGRGRPRKDASAPRPTPASGTKVGSESLATTPKRRGQPRKDASPVAEGARTPTTEGKRGPGRPRKDGSSPAASKKGETGSPSATPKRRGRPRVLPRTTVTDVSGKELVRDMKDGPSTTDNDGSTALSVTEDDGGEAPSAKLPLMAKEPATFTTPERSNKPCKLALVAAEGDCAPRPLLMPKEPATFTTPECSTKPGKLALVAADEDSAPPLDADKEDGTQAPFEASVLPLDTDKSAPVKATRPTATPIAENKAAVKAVSAPPKGRGQESKPASAAAGELRPRRRGAPKPGKMLLLNVDKVVPPKPQKMLLLNVDKVLPDNPMFCVLALPAPVPAATKA